VGYEKWLLAYKYKSWNISETGHDRTKVGPCRKSSTRLYRCLRAFDLCQNQRPCM